MPCGGSPPGACAMTGTRRSKCAYPPTIAQGTPRGGLGDQARSRGVLRRGDRGESLLSPLLSAFSRFCFSGLRSWLKLLEVLILVLLMKTERRSQNRISLLISV